MIPLKRTRFTARVATVAAALALAGVGLSACGAPAVVRGGRLRAVGAENEYANVIAQIGGRYVRVSAVMSNPNTDPHSFEVSTSVASSIASARLVVQNGVGYDTFMNQLESATTSAKRDVIEVQTLEGLPADTKNPHLWYKPVTMPRVAAAVAKDLAKLEPRHARYFAARLAAFTTAMAPVNQAIAAFRATFQGVKVATTEPVADYLLSSLGLHNVTPFRFQADVMNGVDPSPEDIAFQQNLFTHHVVKVFCYNAQVNSTVTESLRALATSSGVPVVAVYETMPTPGYDYETWMLAEIAALDKAIRTSTSTTSLLGSST
jgi:zinc/manganese transport system substrate-binding protein